MEIVINIVLFSFVLTLGGREQKWWCGEWRQKSELGKGLAFTRGVCFKTSNGENCLKKNEQDKFKNTQKNRNFHKYCLVFICVNFGW